MMKTKRKTGFTILEVMVAALLLLVLALGGAAALYHTGAMIEKQENKRMAVNQAAARVELMKASPQSEFVGVIGTSTNVHWFIDYDHNQLLEKTELSTSEVFESNASQGKPFNMFTTIKRVPSAVTNQSGYYQVGVAVNYNQGVPDYTLSTSDEQVRMTTLIYVDF